MLKKFLVGQLFPRSNNYQYVAILFVAWLYVTALILQFGSFVTLSDKLFFLGVLVMLSLLTYALFYHVYYGQSAFHNKFSELSQTAIMGIIWAFASLPVIYKNYQDTTNYSGIVYGLLIIFAYYQSIRAGILIVQFFLITQINEYSSIFDHSRIGKWIDKISNKYRRAFDSNKMSKMDILITALITVTVCILTRFIIKDQSFQMLVSLTIVSAAVSSYTSIFIGVKNAA